MYFRPFASEMAARSATFLTCGVGRGHPCRYLAEEWADKKKQGTLDLSDWQLVPSQPYTPQQNNSCDCGVFATSFAYLLSENLPINKVSIRMLSLYRQSSASPAYPYARAHSVSLDGATDQPEEHARLPQADGPEYRQDDTGPQQRRCVEGRARQRPNTSSYDQ